jgi:hypothetical protein
VLASVSRSPLGGVAVVLRVMLAVGLALGLVGCGVIPGPVVLLTGIEACYAGGEHPAFQGVLVPDAEYGTRIEGNGPVMWPVGYTSRRLPGGKVEVLDQGGNVVATTGRTYMMAPAPEQPGEAQRILEPTGAIPSPNCYGWDLVDCSPDTTDDDADSYCPRK